MESQRKAATHDGTMTFTDPQRIKVLQLTFINLQEALMSEFQKLIRSEVVENDVDVQIMSDSFVRMNESVIKEYEEIQNRIIKM